MFYNAAPAFGNSTTLGQMQFLQNQRVGDKRDVILMPGL